jgi:hypothetical protein
MVGPRGRRVGPLEASPSAERAGRDHRDANVVIRSGQCGCVPPLDAALCPAALLCGAGGWLGGPPVSGGAGEQLSIRSSARRSYRPSLDHEVSPPLHKGVPDSVNRARTGSRQSGRIRGCARHRPKRCAASQGHAPPAGGALLTEERGNTRSHLRRCEVRRKGLARGVICTESGYGAPC